MENITEVFDLVHRLREFFVELIGIANISFAFRRHISNARVLERLGPAGFFP